MVVLSIFWPSSGYVKHNRWNTILRSIGKKKHIFLLYHEAKSQINIVLITWLCRNNSLTLPRKSRIDLESLARC